MIARRFDRRRILPDFGCEPIRNFADDATLVDLEPSFDVMGPKDAGYRLSPARLCGLSVVAHIADLVATYLGPAARPVRGLLFDKRVGANWSLGLPQDRTIEVRRKVDVAGFGPWTRKAGRHHVAPPTALLASMMTVRLHLDDVDDDNAPLLVVPGSHLSGLIPEPEIAAVIDRCGRQACLASRGDLWLYSTLILHASDAARAPRHRRVLQIDFSADVLPGGLDWATA